MSRIWSPSLDKKAVACYYGGGGERMRFVIREQSDYETDSGYVYDSLEEALEALEERKAVALEQGGDVGPLADDGSPFVTGFRADFPDGGFWEVWVEEVGEEVGR